MDTVVYNESGWSKRKMSFNSSSSTDMPIRVSFMKKCIIPVRAREISDSTPYIGIKTTVWQDLSGRYVIENVYY